MKEKAELNKTILNFALVFRTDLETFEKIRGYLLESGAQLIYQTKSTEKIIVSRVSNQTFEGRKETPCFQLIEKEGKNVIGLR